MAYKKFKNIQLPTNLNRPILVDENGLPRYWSVIWSSIYTHNLELNSETAKLRHIESLYLFADKIKLGYLDDIISGLDIVAIGDLLEAYFIQLRNQSNITGATEINWQTCFSFVKTIITLLSKSQIDSNAFQKIESKLFHLGQLYGQLRIQKSKRPDHIRSLPADVIRYLYEMLDPSSESTLNPFKRTITRWNVFLTYICMLHMGLRRGEALLLQVNSIKSAFDDQQGRKRYWINVITLENEDYLDPRYSKPSIKTIDSIRQIPVSELTANLIQTYTENFRGRPPHPFLFNSQWNTPLSHESLTKYYEKISNFLPKDALQTLKNRTGKNTIAPHDLRHTCAVVRLSQLLENGDTVELAMPKMRVFFGWSRESNMPPKYAKAVFEDRVSSVWSNIMDERVAILRNIPKAI
ncbi:MAG: tyrosine-type recombinase/integrase [Methylophilus sp.]|nr:tyrosine-type recombinase/integrase [Methylophilus sp.]